MSRTTEQNAERRERYRYLRHLGYTPREAYKRRDWKTIRVEHSIRSKESYLRRKETLTPQQILQLNNLSKHRTQQWERQRAVQIATTVTPLKTKADRWLDFSRWSKRKQFPASFQQIIDEYNINNGLDIHNSFGYRVFYHRYVNKIPEIDAIIRTETRDT